jgi:glycerol-3-phosphate dehydrogenase
MRKLSMERSCPISSIPRRRMLSTSFPGFTANGRYLPGIKLPDNIEANPDIAAVAREADILIFNFPHQV